MAIILTNLYIEILAKIDEILAKNKKPHKNESVRL
jgi:hypothetical protein